MATTSEKCTVPLFREVQDDFEFWQVRVKAFLMEEDENIAITRKQEESTTDHQKAAEAKAWSVILLGLRDVPLAAMNTFLYDPKEIWDAFNARYNRDSRVNKINIQTTLAKLRYRGSQWRHANSSMTNQQQSLMQ